MSTFPLNSVQPAGRLHRIRAEQDAADKALVLSRVPDLVKHLIKDAEELARDTTTRYSETVLCIGKDKNKCSAIDIEDAELLRALIRDRSLISILNEDLRKNLGGQVRITLTDEEFTFAKLIRITFSF